MEPSLRLRSLAPSWTALRARQRARRRKGRFGETRVLCGSDCGVGVWRLRVAMGRGFGSHAAGCGNRHVTLPATREESCCYPRGVSKAVSTTLPRLCQVPGLDHLLWDHSSPTATVLEGRWVTKEPGVDEEVVTRQVWVLPCSDVSSGVVMQRSQQWSFRQTSALRAEFDVSGDVTGRARAKTGG